MAFKLNSLILCLILLFAAADRSAAEQQDRREFKTAQEIRFATFLARSTLSTLHDANRSGNYSVLRDLAAPQVQKGMSDAALADHFRRVRKARVRLGAALLHDPVFTTAPVIIGGKILWMRGHIPAGQEKVDFKIVFLKVGKTWQFIDIDIGGMAVSADAAPEAAAEESTLAGHADSADETAERLWTTIIQE